MIIVSSSIPPEGSIKTERVELLLGSALRDDGVRYSRNSVTVGPQKLGARSVVVVRSHATSKDIYQGTLQVRAEHPNTGHISNIGVDTYHRAISL